MQDTKVRFIYRTVLTMSSILRMLLTVSLARVMALVLTRRGWTTFSSRILVMAPFLTLIPAVFSPWACLLRSSVTVPKQTKIHETKNIL